MKLTCFLIAGARPNFMKIAPIFKEMERKSHLFDPIIVHTGQHYDEKMSKIFFEELELPRPHIYLGVGSGSHAQQTAEIMKRFEPQLLEHQPHLVIVVGDVNSTVSCSLTAAKIRYENSGLKKIWQNYEAYLSNRNVNHNITAAHLKRRRSHAAPIIAHVEAGLRSFDFDMPEEINRVETDILSDMLFTTAIDGDENLIAEGIDPRKIFFVGNVMIDSLQSFLPKAVESKIFPHFLQKYNRTVTEHEYVLVTLHRPSNVDNLSMLEEIMSALVQISNKFPVVFPMHPRTQKLVQQLPSQFLDQIHNSQLLITDPIGYLDFLHLQTKAKIVLTDSGGIQEESSYLGIPCLTLRPNTERPVTIREGTNALVPLSKKEIVKHFEAALEKHDWQPSKIQYWDGNTSRRIVEILEGIGSG